MDGKQIQPVPHGQQLKLSAENRELLANLAWAIDCSRGEFRLFLLRCDYTALRSTAIEELQAACSEPLLTLALAPETTKLFSALSEQIGTLDGNDRQLATVPNGVLVTGLEAIADLDGFLGTLNQMRETFREHCPFPIILVVEAEFIRRFQRQAKDFETWASIDVLEVDPTRIEAWLTGQRDQLFLGLIDVTAPPINQPLLDTCELSDVTAALRDLQQVHPPREIEPDVLSFYDFLCGRDAYEQDRLTEAIAFYQRGRDRRSTALAPPPLDSAGQTPESTPYPRLQALAEDGDLLPETGSAALAANLSALANLVTLHIGLCYYRRSVLRDRSGSDLDTARSLLLDVLETCAKVDAWAIVSRFIGIAGEVLRDLEDWETLRIVAIGARRLHELNGARSELSRDYSLLADLALAAGDPSTAQIWADRTEAELGAIAATSQPAKFATLAVRLSLTRARILLALHRDDDAIALLEQQRHQPCTDHPRLYITLLEQLRSLYFQRRQYRIAFAVRADRHAFEHEHGLRAFIGAARLRSPKLTPAARDASGGSVPQTGIAPEIIASGRQRDVTNLVERISRKDLKVTTLYGFSGVGKSSFIHAGLVPALRSQTIETQTIIPVVIRLYENWWNELLQQLRAAIAPGDRQPLTENDPAHGSTSTFGLTFEQACQGMLDQLQHNELNNRRSVLIFDQFEEFFFRYSHNRDRNALFLFLGQCLEIPSLRVIFSLRRTYLYFLLNRPGFECIDGDLLSKRVLYRLGNFDHTAARQILQQLANLANFAIEPALLDMLIADLGQDYGKIRPIELQIVGAQLQQDGVSTLAAYQRTGGKTALIQRYLDRAVDDCGPEHRALAELVLYLLADKSNKRPMKTRTDLEKEIELFVSRGQVQLTNELETESLWADLANLAGFENVEKFENVGNAEGFEDLEGFENVEDFENLENEANLGDRSRVAAIPPPIGFDPLSAAPPPTNPSEAVRSDPRQTSRSSPNPKPQNPTPPNHRAEAIDLILSIFVGSGLAFQIPADLEQRYQLAHDYLAEVIHHYYVDRFGTPFEALQREKSLRNLTERELRHTLIQLQAALDRETQARHEAEVAQIEAAVRSSQVLFLFDDRREALIAALNAGRRLRDVNVPLGLNFAVLDALRCAVYGAQQIDRLRGHEGWIETLAISPTGHTLASGASDGTVRIWSLRTGVCDTLKPSCDWVEAVALSGDGRWLAVVGDRSVFLWWFEAGIDRWNFAPADPLTVMQSRDDPNPTVPTWTIPNRSDWVRSVTFSDDGRQLAIGGHDGVIELFSLTLSSGDRESPQPPTAIYSSAVPDSAIKSLAFLNDQRHVVLGTLDGNVLLWEFGRDRWRVIGEHDAEIVAVVVDRDRVWSSGRNGSIYRWPCDGSGLADPDGVKYRQGEQIASFAVDPIRHRIAVGEFSGTVRVWDLQGQELEHFTAHRSTVRAICFAPNGRSILSGSDDRTISLWQFVECEPGTLCQHDRWIACLALSSDGRYGLSADGNGEIAIWNPIATAEYPTGNHAVLYRWQGFDRPIRDAILRPLPAATHPDQSWEVAAIDRVGITRIWTLTGQLKTVIPPPIDLELAWTGLTIDDAIYASRHGRVWLTDHAGRVWLVLNCQHGSPPTLPEPDDAVDRRNRAPKIAAEPDDSVDLDICDICISSDRRQLAIGHRSGTVELWAINPASNTAAFLYPIVTHTRAIGCLAFSPDNQLLAIGDYDRGLSIWNLSTRQSRRLEGHAAAINSICFSRSSHVLISGSYDRTIRFWSSDTGELLHTISDSTHSIDHLQLIPQRRALISGCRDHSIRLWNFDLEDLIDRGEAIIDRRSSSTERSSS
jgi:WD40 repeat protein